VSPDSTKQSLPFITTKSENDFQIIRVYCALAGQTAEHSFILDFFVSFFIKKKRKIDD